MTQIWTTAIGTELVAEADASEARTSAIGAEAVAPTDASEARMTWIGVELILKSGPYDNCPPCNPCLPCDCPPADAKQLTPAGRVSRDRPPDFPHVPNHLIPVRDHGAALRPTVRRFDKKKRGPVVAATEPLPPAVVIEVSTARTAPGSQAEQGGV